MKYKNLGTKQPAKYCNGKVIYDKKGAITAKNKRWKDDRVKLRIYPCHNHWHLTKLNAK